MLSMHRLSIMGAVQPANRMSLREAHMAFWLVPGKIRTVSRETASILILRILNLSFIPNHTEI
jgi:hypothetical protein